MSDIQHIIGGMKIDASHRHADVYDPATGAVVKRVPLASADDVRAAVDAASAAFPAWAETTPLNRARVMFKI